MDKAKRLMRFSILFFLIVAILVYSVGCTKVIEQDPIYSDVIEYIPIDSDDISSDDILSSEDGTSGEVNSGTNEDNNQVNNNQENNNQENNNQENNQGNNVEENEEQGVLENGIMIFRVSEFGAKGDGKTDDGLAINDAVDAAVRFTAQNPNKKAVVRFDKNKSYLCHKQNYATSSSGAVISINKAANVTLEGDNSVIIGLPTKSYLRIETCSNVKIKGLNFTYDTPVACRAKVVKRDGSAVTFEVPDWYVKAIENNTLADSSFAIPVNNRRDHSWIKSIEKVDATHCKVIFSSGGYIIMSTEEELKTATDFRCTNYVDLPTPGYSHNGTAFRLMYNQGGVEFENCNIWNASQFIFQITGNLDNSKIGFTNVKLTPRDSNACPTVAWRDVIHAKDNRGILSFNECNFGGTHDDLFNVSNTQLRVDAVENGTTLKLYGLDYNGQYQSIIKGDTVVAFDPVNDKYYGEAKVTEIVRQKGADIVIKLDKNIGIEKGAYIYFKEYATRAVINGGEFSGTVRIRGASTITNAIFTLNAMWTAYEGVNATVEGPIPENITYKNCIFKGANDKYESWTRMTFDCTLKDGTTASSYSVKNIVFDGCKFSYTGIIDRSNPNVNIKNEVFN